MKEKPTGKLRWRKATIDDGLVIGFLQPERLILQQEWKVTTYSEYHAPFEPPNKYTHLEWRDVEIE